MASSQEESVKPVGFTLKISKFKKPTNKSKKKRYGIRNKRPFQSTSQTDDLSLSPIKEEKLDIFGLDSPCSVSTQQSTPTSSSSRKRQRRPKVLASISANAKRMPIPIPSFQMIHKNSKADDLRKKKLRELERAFFDEEDDDVENDSTKSNRSQQSIDLNVQSKIKKSPGKGANDRYHEKYRMRDELTNPKEQNSQVSPRNERTIDTSVDPIQTSPTPGQGFDTNVGDESDNNDEHEELDDSNGIDFGEDDGGGFDFDDAEEGNCKEQASTNDHDESIMETNAAPSTESTPMEHVENHISIPSSFDLDHQVDLLFQKTDTSAMSMNMFRKELQRRLGVSLTKPEKKQIKARVMALLRGEIVPSSKTETTIEITEVRDLGEDERDENNDETNSTRSTEETEKETTILSNNTKESEKNTVASTCGMEIEQVPTTAHFDTETAEKEIKDSIPNTKEIEMSAISASGTKKNEKQTTAQPPQMNAAPIETNISSREPAVPKKKEAKKRERKNDRSVSDDLTANQASTAYCVEIEIEKDSNPQPETQPKTKTGDPKAKRQRKSKPKNPNGADKSSGTPKAAPEKPKQTRKRTRMAAACALCKTCPCQRGYTGTESENIATLDVKNFSRSDEAVERTLIRRLQKLEKSTESMEEQTETVRRRLKKHRRDVAKRRERQHEDTSSSGGEKTGDSYFLPDAEVFERQQNESEDLPSSIVGKARKRIFQNVPTYQPTLFEMMGIPRANDKSNQNIGFEIPDESGNSGEQNIPNYLTEIANEDDDDDDDDDDTPREYVPERECKEKVHRFEWNNGAKAVTGEEEEIPPGSIFDTILPYTQDPKDEECSDKVKIKDGASVPLWDDLFDSEKKEKKEGANNDPMAGLDDLLCLFDDKSSEPNHDDGSVVGGKDDRIDPTLLSQGAQKVAHEVISSVASMERLSTSYPNWKENVYFAMLQKDPEEIRQALENVQESRMRLQNQKEEMLRAWESKNAALQVFEKALKTSFDRSNLKSGTELGKIE